MTKKTSKFNWLSVFGYIVAIFFLSIYGAWNYIVAIAFGLREYSLVNFLGVVEGMSITIICVWFVHKFVVDISNKKTNGDKK